MRSNLLLLALALSGSVQAGEFTNIFKSSEEQFAAQEEQFATQVEQWAGSKVQEFIAEFKGDLPFSVEGEMRRVDSSKISFAYEKMEPMNDRFQSDFVKYQKDMTKLRRTYDIAVLTLNDFTGTQAWFESELEKYASDFDTVIVRTVIVSGMDARHAAAAIEERRNAVLFGYCKSHDIEQSKCKADLAGKVILMRHLLDAQPQYRKHLDWLKNNVESINNFTDKVAEHGVAFEKNLYFRRVASSGCKNMTNFDGGEFAGQMVYENFRPQKSVVYDLGRFKVL